MNWSDIFKRSKPMKVFAVLTGMIHMSGNIHFNKKSEKFKQLPRDKRFNPVMAFMVEHPEKGCLLVDTGLHPSFADSSTGNFGWLLGRISKTRVKPGQDIVTALKAAGKNPRDIKKIILSHLHMDHPSSLPLFREVNNLEVHADQEEIKILHSPLSLFKGYIKDHFKGFEVRPIEYGPAIEPFDQVWDVWGDASVFMAATPGHTPGHASAIINASGGPILLTCDAAHRNDNLKQLIPPIGDFPQGTETIKKIVKFTEQHPQVRVFHPHDPDQLNDLRLAPNYYE